MASTRVNRLRLRVQLASLLVREAGLETGPAEQIADRALALVADWLDDRAHSETAPAGALVLVARLVGFAGRVCLATTARVLRAQIGAKR